MQPGAQHHFIRPLLARREPVRFVIVGLVVLSGVLLGACSSGGSSATGITCPDKVDATVHGTDFKFTPSTLTAKAGTWTMKFVNDSGTGHNFEIHGANGKADAKARGVGCAQFALSAGTYSFFCSIAGHEGSGMKGTLTVS